MPRTRRCRAHKPRAERSTSTTSQTRIDPPSDPDVEVLEIDERQEPAPRLIKAQKLPLDEFPSEKSVVSRIVKSVVAALPSAIRKAVDKTGQHIHRSRKAVVAGDPRRRASAAQPSGIDARAWREMRTAPIFDGLPNEALRDALLSGDAHVLRWSATRWCRWTARSRWCAPARWRSAGSPRRRSRPSARRRAPSRSAGGKVDKKERKRRTEVGPLIARRRAEPGHVRRGRRRRDVDARADSTPRSPATRSTPAQVVTLSRGARRPVEAHLSVHGRPLPPRRAGGARQARRAPTRAKAMVADFFIRHGLSVSMTLRVRKIDTCIECGACEQACEDRYGVKRLSLNGRILGGLDFVDACHTCTDQRCIDPCNFDAISFDAAAQGGPDQRGRLHRLHAVRDGLPLRRHRDARARRRRRCSSCASTRRASSASATAPPRKAKLRRMASKCDHCAFYEDQACITRLPDRRAGRDPARRTR